MRKNELLAIASVMILPVVVLMASCSKTMVQTQQVSTTEPEVQQEPDRSAEEAEQAGPSRLEGVMKIDFGQKSRPVMMPQGHLSTRISVSHSTDPYCRTKCDKGDNTLFFNRTI
jgi:hypothetical protein